MQAAPQRVCYFDAATFGADAAGALPGIMEAVSRLAGAEAGAAAEAATVAGAAGKLLNTLELPEALPRLP